MRMRFPYFYQLMIGFLIVILSLMGITSASLLHFGRSQLLNDVEESFIHYAELVREAEFNTDKLEAYNQMLDNKEIEYTIFDAKGRIQYPDNITSYDINLAVEESEALKNGKIVKLQMSEMDLRGNERETASIYLPIIQEGKYNGFIGVERPLSQIELNMDELKWNVLRASLLSAIIAVLISIIFSYFMVKRVNKLSKASQKVAKGDYDIYIDHSNRDEIDRLSADFNKMIKSLKEWRNEVMHLEERRRTFMQDAVHEMRTPLTTINGLIEGLEHGVFDEKQEIRSIKIMSKETKRLIRLVNENLDYENIQSNKIILRKRHFPLVEALIEISEQLGPKANESNNEIKIVENIGEIKVYADFDRFKQIIVNLLKNSLQFTKNGRIVIDAFQTEKFICIKISDTGIGMTDEQMKNIWDRYYKADPSRKNTKYGESGLGLAIVKQLVEQHDGSITVKSVIDKGSNFELKFPKKRELKEKFNT